MEFKTKLNISVKNSNHTTLIWKKGSTSIGTNIHMSEDNAKFIVGENCMFSYDIEVWVSDTHSIIDKDTKKSLNRVSNLLIIGDKCWKENVSWDRLNPALYEALNK